MSTKPSAVPTWDSSNVNAVAPTTEATNGWAVDQTASSSTMNYWMRQVYLFCQYLFDGFFVGEAGQPGLRGTGGTGNTNGVQALGSGTGAGLVANGGSGGTGAHGGVGNGGSTGTCYGFEGVGGADGGAGIHGIATTNDSGGFFEGAGTGVGVYAKKGASTTDAVKADGDLDLSTASNASATTAKLNRLNPKNVCKAWGRILSGGSLALRDGFNVASVGLSGTNLLITLAQAMGSTNYAVNVNMNLFSFMAVSIVSSTQFTISAKDSSGTAIDFGVTPQEVHFHVFGAQ